jgi:DNA-binding NarL/FixJ family response regulator
LLNHAPILIAEDDPLLAFELQVAVKDAEGEAVGPARSVVAALEILQLIIVAGAVLEVQLPDGDVTPVAKVFIARRVPMVFQSDADLPPELQSLCPDVPVFKRPVSARLLVERLSELIRPQDWE